MTINGRIKSSFLGFEQGMFTVHLYIETAHGTWGWGHYEIDNWDSKTQSRHGSEFGVDVLVRLLKVAGVNNWNDLVGKYVRILVKDNLIYSIGNIIQDEWICVPEMFIMSQEAKE